ncbi:MAG: outer membrane protein assembly factor BamA [Alphaproteobacteria bacterium]|nr:outer membrane protein assembly factor BamA [Alphaproteobacteria bacterium]
MKSVKKTFVLGLLLASSSVLPQYAAAAGITVQKIEIKGSQRIERETVLSHLGIRPGEEVDPEVLDQGLKHLFESGLFVDAHLEMRGSTLVIAIVENPIVNRVAIEGNDDVSDENLMKAELSLKPRQVYTLARVKSDTKRLQDIYRVKGYFGAVVTPKVIQKDQNRVDVVFEVREGKKTAVRQIYFVGNKHYSTSRLESTIQTKETRWYRFFTNDDNYDPDRVAYDQSLLRKFYLEHGYADFIVKSAVAELSLDKKDFYITFTLEEGERYTFGKVSVSSQIKDIDTKSLEALLTMKAGDWYSTKDLEKTTTKITDALGDRGYAFVEVQPKPEKNTENRTIDLVFEIQEGPKVYIDRVVIVGNDRTDEEVIRRELRFHEGDAFNTNNLKISETRLKNLGYFKKVNIQREPGKAPDQTNIMIEVEEDSTGELSFGGGFSTSDGPLASITFSESNFRGKGQQLSVGLTVAKKRQEFDISFTEPYFLGKDLAAGFDLYRIRQHKYMDAAFDQRIYGARFRIGYMLSEYLNQGWSYTIQQEEISGVKDDASRFIKEQRGSSIASILGHTLLYDRRDNRIDPTEGYFSGLANDWAGLGGKIKYLRNKIYGGWYYPLMDQVVFGLKGNYGHMFETGKKIRVADRFTLGGETLRGFEMSGVGPRDKATGDPLGGRQYFSATAEVLFPLGLPSEFDVKGATFCDMGSVWNSGDPSKDVHESKKLRASVGFGLRWKSPMGPISIDVAYAFKKDKRDKTQPILFGFTTRF